MSAPGTWQEQLAELSKEWGTAEVEFLNEAITDLYAKYTEKKRRIVGLTALVVEDSVMLRMMLEDWLTKAGLIVTGRAQNGYEAVKLFNGDEHYDFVFLNVTMPELDGIDALSDFKKDRDSQIIIVTSTQQPELLLRAVKNGAHNVLYRPFDYGALLSVMCTDYRFSPDKYEMISGILTEMGKGVDGTSHELTQQDVYKLVNLSSSKVSEKKPL